MVEIEASNYGATCVLFLEIGTARDNSFSELSKKLSTSNPANEFASVMLFTLPILHVGKIYFLEPTKHVTVAAFQSIAGEAFTKKSIPSIKGTSPFNT
jgi:hypothetical protein